MKSAKIASGQEKEGEVIARSAPIRLRLKAKSPERKKKKKPKGVLSQHGEACTRKKKEIGSLPIIRS